MECLEPVVDVSVGGWIAERLGGPVGTVGSVVPRGFAAYARVLHPVEVSGDGPPMAWAQVCAATGRIPHALMQWTAIATPAGSTLSTSRSVLWNQLEPCVGTLVPETLGALLDVLGPITEAQDCFHALWDGWGWIDGTGGAVLQASTTGEPTPAAGLLPGVAPEVWQGPRLRLPGREYLLFRGPLSASLRMGWQVTATRFDPQSPSLLWPRDHSWCLATEIDFDSTLVAGSPDLIEAILAASSLEAWRVQEDDDLTAFGDVINAGP